MDKDLVNNQIILMRKMVRNVKHLVKQKLMKQMKKLELRLNKQIEKTAKKLENKISNKKKELIAINGVNVDEVSKQALIQTKKYFEDIIKNGQTSPESKALARIANNERIEKLVNQFKEENPDSDQWLPSQIELWQQKKLIKKNKILKKKGLTADDNQINQKNDSKSTETDQKSVKINENFSQSKTSEMKKNLKVKRISKKEEIKQTDKQKVSITEETPSQQKKPKSDPFFLSKDSNLDETDDNSEEEEEKEMSPKKGFRNEMFRPKEKNSKFSKTTAKSHSIKKNFKPKKFENKASNRDKGKSAPEEDLHPSWAAKRSAKDKLKIDLNQKPLAKKIKFSEQ